MLSVYFTSRMESKLWFVCSLVVACVTLSECASSDKSMAIHFTTPENTSADNVLRLNPLLPNSTNFTSYSICFRANLQTWDENWLFETGILTFILNEYKLGTGTFFNGEMFPHQFDYRSGLRLTPNFWNSFCITYNAESFQLRITMNGKLILDEIETFSGAKELIETKIVKAEDWYKTASGQYAAYFRATPIKLGATPFSGLISDFNFWSRTLTNTEVDQYSFGCRNDFEDTSKPDILKWSNVKITYPSVNYTTQTDIKKSDFCPSQQQNATDFFSITSLTYDDAFQQCFKFNGKLPLIRKGLPIWEDVNFQKVLQSDIDYDKSCLSDYWVPVIKSKTNTTKWILDVRDGSPGVNFINILHSPFSYKSSF
jgi:hypothetical protein